MQRLNEQTAIVTGGGSGIGAGIAAVLAAEGATVVVADRDGDRAARTAAAIEADGGRAFAVVCDVSRDGDVQAAVNTTGRVDIVASNAGIYPIASIEET